MTTITSVSTLVLLLTSLIHANGLNLINQTQIKNFLQEIYYQPYQEFSRDALLFRYPNFDSWKRPADKPITIAIQVGHLMIDQLPLELRQLAQGGGARRGTLKEVDINNDIAKQAARVLTQYGYKVELLPSLIPDSYNADVFVSIHANAGDANTSGFFMGGPAVDYSEKNKSLKWSLIQEYASSTGMMYLDRTSENIKFYYAFNWSKFKHTIFPKTPAILIETGNMNNLNDLIALTLHRDRMAEGIANGIRAFLQQTHTSPEDFE